jgi:hypothetical protein
MEATRLLLPLPHDANCVGVDASGPKIGRAAWAETPEVERLPVLDTCRAEDVVAEFAEQGLA